MGWSDVQVTVTSREPTGTIYSHGVFVPGHEELCGDAGLTLDVRVAPRGVRVHLTGREKIILMQYPKMNTTAGNIYFECL